MPAQWRCHKSGDCCRHVGAVSMTHAERDALDYVLDPDIALMLTWRDGPRPGFVQLVGDPACPLLAADGSCSVYAARPTNCRRWGCFRPTTDEPFALAVRADPETGDVLPVRLWTSRPVARQMARMQAAAQPWALAHGWIPDADVTGGA